MEEEEYIALNNLLTKYKVNCLKNYANINLDPKIRERYIKQVRYIDYIRKDMPLGIYEKVAENAVCRKFYTNF